MNAEGLRLGSLKLGLGSIACGGWGWAIATTLLACAAGTPAPATEPPAGAAAAVPTAASSPTSAAAATSATAALPADGEVRRILAERIGKNNDRVGIVVGLISPSGRRSVSYGSRALGDSRPLDADTLFEIGSVTKVFTSLLLALAVERHELTLDDPVANYLPASVKLPASGSRLITLRDLATHTSGLPRMPDNFAPRDASNPYADYSVAQLYQFLSNAQLSHPVGSTYDYSNVGVGLLGHALALHSGQSYEDLVRSRVTDPLGMPSTRITLSSELQARLAPGHTPAFDPTSNWDLPTFAGAGALRSSANDLSTFLAAAIGLVDTPFTAAFASMQAVQRPIGDKLSIGLGWHIRSAHGKDIVWHNGGTGGYRTFIGYDPRAQTGVAVLSNASSTPEPDDIGFHLLDAESPLEPAPGAVTPHTQVTIDPRLLDGYVGRYQLAASVGFTVTLDGDQLFAQLTGQDSFPVYPESEKKFFYKVVEATLTFETDAQGQAQALVLHQNGRDHRAPRIGDAPVMPKQVPLDPKVFDRYVGRYELKPGVVLSITRDGSHFFAQLTGQPVLEIFASGKRDFFWKVVDAQLTFDVDSKGPATACTLHQGGSDKRATRIP